MKRLREFLKGSEIDPSNVERSEEPPQGSVYNMLRNIIIYTLLLFVV